MSGRHSGSRRRAGAAVVLATVAAFLAGIGIWATADGGPADEDLPENAVSGGPPGGPCAPDAVLAPRCGAWWGAYIPYDENGSLTAPVYAFEKKIGRRLDLVYTYHDMSGNELDGRLLTPDEQELGRDRLLMLAWESTVWKEPHHAGWTETQLGWKNIASGRYDTEIVDPQIRRIKAYGKRVFLSFDQEVDARIKEGAGTPEEYVAAYRHLRDRFERLGARNVVWVWTVSGYLGSADLMKRLYPGDEYVDWLAMDQYNYYTCHKTTDWKDFERSQRPSHDWLIENISGEKPLMLAEFATVPDPADPDRQREWYAAVPQVARTMPKVKAMVHWNRAVPGEGCDLTVNGGPGLEGYRLAGRDDWFRQPVPSR
ncbi:glycosyl hydrolase [Streptomyces sp. WMMC940]|uniref:glycosyl hydrolase n=1 Tax=Streptomyces sp. WMMC940 TaxID=3015153 RepID=UPI0022B695E0|nr:glycosyl hydrolase [Streptomyces sp. WMMC940]MCZ7459873.1 glycosyl hydrolase [Streptomyces sp. WMMC940]